MAVVLDFISYDSLPSFIDNYFQLLIEQKLFALDYCKDVMSVLSKIINRKNKNNSSLAEVAFFKKLETFLIESVCARNVPVKIIGTVFDILDNLRKITFSSLDWLFSCFNVCTCTWVSEYVDLIKTFQELDNILYKNLTEIQLNINTVEHYEREFAYIGEMLVCFDIHLSEQTKTKLINIMKPRSQCVLEGKLFSRMKIDALSNCFFLENSKVWAFTIIVYSKMCLKEPTLLDDWLDALNYAVNHSSDYARHCSIAALYDLCNM